MGCQQVERLLDDYLAGKLAPSVAAQLEAHIADCSACQALFLPEDTELDLLLSSDWFQLEPPKGWVRQVVTSTQRSLPLWAGMGVLALSWSAYVSLWILLLVRFWRPPLLTATLDIVRRLGGMLLTEMGKAYLALWRGLGLVKISPLVVAALLLVVLLTIVGFRRLEKEGLA
ncbi:MAG: zf-HC2 domain-containing protein [Bacillota bacterium]|jgi:hypothetical protein